MKKFRIVAMIMLLSTGAAQAQIISPNSTHHKKTTLKPTFERRQYESNMYLGGKPSIPLDSKKVSVVDSNKHSDSTIHVKSDSLPLPVNNSVQSRFDTLPFGQLIDFVNTPMLRHISHKTFAVQKKIGEIRFYTQRENALLQDSLAILQAVHSGQSPNALQEDTLTSFIREWTSSVTGSKEELNGLLYDRWVENVRARILPARNVYFARKYYGSDGSGPLENLRSNILRFNAQYASIYSELVAGYAGPVRLGVGALLSTQNLTKPNSDSLRNLSLPQVDSALRSIDSANVRKNSLQNLLAGGGNVMLMATYPIFDINDRKDQIKFSMIAFDQLSFDIPALGVAEKKFAAINNVGLNTIFAYNLSNTVSDNTASSFGIFLINKTSLINGNADFFRNIGMENKKALGYFDFQFGFNISSFRITIDKQLTTNKSINQSIRDWTVGVSFNPSNLK